ncbi:ribonuclease H, partial [Trifolium pratense]
MSSSSAYPRCGYFEESFLHCVCDCPTSKNLWFSIGFSAPQFYDTIDNISWIKEGTYGTSLNIFAAGVCCLGTPCRAGFGGVLRNSNGAWISGFSGFIAGSTDILYAELLAIYHGLSLAKDLGHDHVACYSDSLNSLSLIQ